MGGKSAFVVFDDVDVDEAVEWIMFGGFWTNGEKESNKEKTEKKERMGEEGGKRKKKRLFILV